jgi:hypothetical protein
VYTYATGGRETISVASAHHDYPSTTYATVRVTPCGWSMDHPIAEEHVDHWRFCGPADATALESQHQDIEFLGKQEHRGIDCRPPVALTWAGFAAGTTRDGRCDGDGTRAAMRARSVGTDRVVVGGVAVDALHVVADAALTGSTRGHSRYEYWLDTTNGLLLQLRRDTDTDADSIFGGVHYTESLRLTLLSLEPRT